MIISASRRTDIPAYYSRWFMNRIRAESCLVPNPFFPSQIAQVSLAPKDVDAIVFWTRNPRPLFSNFDELDSRGFKFYFQYTILDYPMIIDAHTPRLQRSLDAFRFLADRIGADRVIWRYDPIVLSEITPVEFHRETFYRITQQLSGYTRRVVISFMDLYSKASSRLKQMEEKGAYLRRDVHLAVDAGVSLPDDVKSFVFDLVEFAQKCGMEIVSCAEKLDLSPFGVHAGACIDVNLINRVFGLNLAVQKDPYQRKACGCAASKDIGMYETCLFGCQYCYATRSFERARENYRRHNPDSASLYEIV